MGTMGQSVTLANSIIGVGILAMPFCFQQCGVLLATLILLFMGLISRLCCYFLLKSALLARRRNFEFLAFHVFGPSGKMAVEVGIIGFLMGTCIAYFVVVGDLGPQIIAKLFNINQSDILRTSIMVIVSLVCVLPLGLLRNVDSLSNVSAATICFYFCLVIKVVAEAATQLPSGEWHSKMEMWKPSGVLQCVPIFSMALFCQTQLFEIFESMSTLSLEKMNVVTKNAINICTAVYFTLGLFGYIAFCSQDISGNILMSLSPTMASDVIKLGFVMSLAFSFPLIIFPCRASLYSFLFRKAHPAHHDHIINHSIPETTFRCMTVAIIGAALFVSLLLPNIELVLGLLGATIGTLVCLVFPAACFINLTFKNTNERLLAKGVVVLGLVIMVLGTYANLEAAESRLDRPSVDERYSRENIDKIVQEFFDKMDKSQGLIVEPKHKDELEPPDTKIKHNDELDSEVQPPNPVPPESQSNEKIKIEEKRAQNDEKKTNIEDKAIKVEEVIDKVSESHPRNLKKNEAKTNGKAEDAIKSIDEIKNNVEKPKEEVKPPSPEDKNDMIKQQKLIETIKQHGEEQKELIKEQKEILNELMKTKNELQQNKKEVDSKEAKIIAVESIQKIANMAIQSLSGSDKPDGNPEEGNKKTADEAVQEIAKKAVETLEAIKEEIKPKETAPEVKALPPVVNNANVQNSNPVLVPINVQSNQNLQAKPQNIQPSPIIQNLQNGAQYLNAANVPSANQNAIPPVIPNIASNNQLNMNNLQPNLNNVQPNNINNVQPNINNVQPNINNVQPNINQPNLQQIVNQQRQPVNQPNVNQNANIVQNQASNNIPANNQQNNQQIIQNSNQNIQTEQKHSHSPDEPQSYKQGEDAQEQKPKPVAQNVPLPIAVNNLNQDIKDQTNNEMNMNKVNLNNGFADSNQNAPVRQKREVVDCTKKTTLTREDKEICSNLLGTDKKTQEILPSNVDFSDVGLPKSLPVEGNFIHHIRSLKSVETTKNR